MILCLNLVKVTPILAIFNLIMHSAFLLNFWINDSRLIELVSCMSQFSESVMAVTESTFDSLTKPPHEKILL